MAAPRHRAPPGDAAAPDDEAIERARKLFAGPCRFAAGADRLESLPAPSLPEIAFCGRSNVGKSSLINALTGRHALARVSRTPGRTQQINFFALGEALMLVDLPGYGYARASKRKVEAWSELARLYLKGRPSLRRALVLIDARHGAKDVDREIFALLDAAAVSYQAVLTKIDELAEDELQAVSEHTASELSRHTAAHPEVLATSAHDGAGIPALRAALAALGRLS